MNALVFVKSLVISLACIAALVGSAAFGQSTDQNFPTPITSTEISGSIGARDIGDSRLTAYYFAFNGGQGDIFINAVTTNFAGDIDIFTADTLQPLAKMISYPEAASSETGRLIYLRRPARLLLRVDGRSPNDSPATFRIRFGGSFIALEGKKEERAPSVSGGGRIEGGIRVNSVGTIILAPPAEDLEVEPDKAVQHAVVVKEPAKVKSLPAVTPSRGRVITRAPGVRTVFGDKAAAKPPTRKKDTAKEPVKSSANAGPSARKAAVTSNPPRVVIAELIADPLASINLVVELKSGGVIQRPMNEILRFSVDKGILTVILKDGKITRYSLLDVSSFTMR